MYVAPSANTREALCVLYNAIGNLQTTYLEGVYITAEDFNQANMKTVLSHFHQHVDLVCINIKEAFREIPRPQLVSSDHLADMLTPAYKLQALLCPLLDGGRNFPCIGPPGTSMPLRASGCLGPRCPPYLPYVLGGRAAIPHTLY